ncbi:single-stranded DNA-binding protein [Synechococcus sp. M16CYN]|uniref:single-stranded DNA-binding protein n=1 Tax=Synechococcus sp. M16CYN TaxID=3103139 RepID=UPI0032448CAC
MNHCVLEVEVIDTPTVRYTQDNQTPIADMSVRFDPLRDGDPPSELKVVGWGNLAQDLQNRVRIGQRLLIEGRLRMNTVLRRDGMKEKRAEFTLARLHLVDGATAGTADTRRLNVVPAVPATDLNKNESQYSGWNAAPLVPDTDDIPF